MLQRFLNPPPGDDLDPPPHPDTPGRERRRAPFRAAFGKVAAVAGPAAARRRQWASRLYMLGLVSAIGGSYCYASVRGDNIAHQVVRNGHALECAGLLAPPPAGYRPPMGMPPPSTAPCPRPAVVTATATATATVRR